MGTRSVPKGTLPRGMKVMLLPRGLKKKLVIAFSLMSVLPLLVLVYIVVNFIFPDSKTLWETSLIVFLVVLISFLGWMVVRRVAFPIINLAAQAREIAEGNFSHEVKIQATDEVGSLGVSLNQLTQRIRENMVQLRVYGEQTRHLNLEINRRILVLSQLLQVSNLISQSAKLEEVIHFILEKLAQMEGAELNFLLVPDEVPDAFVVRAAVGMDSKETQELLGKRIESAWLRKVLQEKQIAMVDHQRSVAAGSECLQKYFGMENAVCQPIVSMGRPVGLLLSLNRRPDFVFHEDSLDLLKLFGKQVAIAMENEALIRRAEELKLVDDLTGLYNAIYMKNRLEEEVQRAIRYNRSCALVLVNLDAFKQIQEAHGTLTGEKVLRQVADFLKTQITDVDRVGRIGTDEFALILPERNKREAIELAEAIRAGIERRTFKDGVSGTNLRVTLSAGVSENPLDGSSGQGLLDRAADAVVRAKREGKNRVAAG